MIRRAPTRSSQRRLSAPPKPCRRPLAAALAALSTAALLWPLAGCGGGDDPAAGLTGQGLVVVSGGTPAHPDYEGTFDRPRFHDFGEVEWGAILEHTFEFQNTDPVSINVLRAHASCSCTIPRLEAVAPDGTVLESDHSDPNSLARVPPGGLLRVTLRVDAGVVLQPNRDKLVTVRIVTDAPSSAFISLEAHLIARRDLITSAAVADLGTVPFSLGGETDILIGRADDGQLRPTGIAASPEGFVVSFGPDLRSDDHWVVAIRLEPGHPEGYAGGTIEVATVDDEGQPGTPLSVPVRAHVVPDVQISPPNASLRPHEGGLYHEVRILSHLPGHRFRVDDVAVEPRDLDDVEVEPVPLGPDARGAAGVWDLRLRVADPRPGVAYDGRLVVHLDDPQYPVFEIPFVTHSQP